MENNEWSPKRRIELQFQRTIDTIGKSMLSDIEGLTDPLEITNVIRSWIHNMTFHRFAEETAKKMVGSLLNAGEKTWRQAARENSNGRLIYDALRKELTGTVGISFASEINRNAGIIKSLPLDIANQVTRYISEESIDGRRADDIANDILRKFPSMARNRAALIARTEVSKTSTALIQARCENVGLDWYVWRTSEDGRVRDSHRHMESVLVKWTNPPSPERLIGEKNPPAPYHAGNIYNCRCYPEPVVNLDYIKFPVEVYWNGIITKMTRSQFTKIA